MKELSNAEKIRQIRRERSGKKSLEVESDESDEIDESVSDETDESVEESGEEE